MEPTNQSAAAGACPVFPPCALSDFEEDWHGLDAAWNQFDFRFWASIFWLVMLVCDRGEWNKLDEGDNTAEFDVLGSNQGYSKLRSGA